MRKGPVRPSLWLPLYIADYTADTAHLNTEQHGAYLLLLMAAWMRGGRLPVDEEQLAAITRLPWRAWRKHRSVLLSFFNIDRDELVQLRLLQEYEHAVAVQAKRREIGAQGGNASAAQRASKRLINGQPIAQPIGQPDANQMGKQNSTPPQENLKEATPVGALDAIWRDGVGLLMGAGDSESSARSFIGMCVGTYGPDYVLEALRAAHGKADPKGYVRAVLKTKPRKDAAGGLRVAI
jgi:uncharacterized protein YdaU (DUF1376 family)